MARGYLPARWRNMILPDGAMELMINLGDPQKLCARIIRRSILFFDKLDFGRADHTDRDRRNRLCASGRRSVAGRRRVAVLGIPLREFTDQVVELETIMGREIEDLRDALGEARDDDSRFDLLESWLVRRARSRTQPTRSVSYALRVIHGGLDAVRIGRIADTIGISHKHLLREFDRCVGLTPKLFARLCAFQRVIRSVGQKPEADWAGTAATCGYHDQAHLIHEFRAFSGLTPAALSDEARPVSELSRSRIVAPADANKCQFFTIPAQRELGECDP